MPQIAALLQPKRRTNEEKITEPLIVMQKPKKKNKTKHKSALLQGSNNGQHKKISSKS